LTAAPTHSTPKAASGATAAEALKTEARRRADAGEFYGHIAYASLIAGDINTVWPRLHSK
jgi:hypothetical protein